MWILAQIWPFWAPEGVQTTLGAHRIHLHRVSAQTEPWRPISCPKSSFWKTIFALVLTNSYLVLTMDYLVVTIDYLVVTIDYLVVTIDY